MDTQSIGLKVIRVKHQEEEEEKKMFNFTKGKRGWWKKDEKEMTNEIQQLECLVDFFVDSLDPSTDQVEN